MKRKKEEHTHALACPAPPGRAWRGAGARHAREWSGKIRALRVRAVLIFCHARVNCAGHYGKQLILLMVIDAIS
jgi:hypothetical protein